MRDIKKILAYDCEFSECREEEEYEGDVDKND